MTLIVNSNFIQNKVNSKGYTNESNNIYGMAFHTW